jgi:hypothetical protein
MFETVIPGPSGGYTGIGVTGDVLIYGNLLVTGSIDPIYLALTPQASGPVGFTNPLWVDTGGFLRSENIKLENATADAISLSATSIAKIGTTTLSIDADNTMNLVSNLGPIILQAETGIDLNSTTGIITTNCAIKPTAIRDSASGDGTSGQVLTAGTGGQLLWGANGVSSVTAGTNISLTGTASVPIVNLGTLGVLTSTLNTGTQNVQGTSTQFTLTNGGSQSNVQASLGFTSVVSATPTTKANLFNTSVSVETLANKVQMTPTYLLKTVGATAFQVGTVGSAPLTLVGAGGQADGISISQISGAGTVLTSNLSNVKWYPDTLINNNNTLLPTAVPAPQVVSQRLTLTNYGLTNTNNWIDYGATTGGSATTAFEVDNNNYVWVASYNGICRVYDSTITTLLYTHTLTYLGNPATIYVLYYSGGYMFIGGLFDAINGNATPQNSITRVSTSSYTEEPMEDGATFNRGFQVGSSVFCMTDVNGNLVVGGSFLTDELGTTPILYIGSIANPYVAGSAQSWTEFNGGTNNFVYAIYHEPNNNYTYIGGDFTAVNVNISALGYVYGAGFDGGSWFLMAGNAFNNPVYTIQFSNHGGMIWTGLFNGSPIGTSVDYNCYIDPNTLVVSDTNFSMGGYQPNYKQRNFTAGGNALIGFDNTFYVNTAYQVWESLGQTGGSGAVIGINYWNGDWKVILDSYVEVRSHETLSHAQTFNSGVFKYNGTLYANYTITTRDISQQFIGDPTNAFWSPIGTLVGAFS